MGAARRGRLALPEEPVFRRRGGPLGWVVHGRSDPESPWRFCCWGAGTLGLPPLQEKLLRFGQPLSYHVEIVIAACELDHELAQGDEVLHLVAHRTSAAATHLLKLRSLLFGNAEIELERLLRHADALADWTLWRIAEARIPAAGDTNTTSWTDESAQARMAGATLLAARTSEKTLSEEEIQALIEKWKETPPEYPPLPPKEPPELLKEYWEAPDKEAFLKELRERFVGVSP